MWDLNTPRPPDPERPLPSDLDALNSVVVRFSAERLRDATPGQLEWFNRSLDKLIAVREELKSPAKPGTKPKPARPEPKMAVASRSAVSDWSYPVAHPVSSPKGYLRSAQVAELG